MSFKRDKETMSCEHLNNCNKSNQLHNPNYASVRCTQPKPSVIKLQPNNTCHTENLSCNLVDHPFIQLDSLQSVNDQPLLLTNYSYEEHFVNQNNNKNPVITKVQNTQNDNSADCPSQTQASKKGQRNILGMFQYMKFEHRKGESDGDVTVEPQDLPSVEDGEDLTTRQKLMHILHSKPVHIIIIVLVIVDCFLVIFELLIDLGVITFNPENPLPGIFHGFSIAILSVFMIEIMLKLYADHRHFIRHKVEVLDAVVVVISFAVDVALVFFEDSEALAALGLLVILRLWRIFRIVNGIIVTVKTKADERVHAMKEKIAAIENLYEEATQQLKKQEEDIKTLRKLLQDHNVDLNEETLLGDKPNPQEGDTVHVNIESTTV